MHLCEIATLHENMRKVYFCAQKKLMGGQLIYHMELNKER